MYLPSLLEGNRGSRVRRSKRVDQVHISKKAADIASHPEPTFAFVHTWSPIRPSFSRQTVAHATGFSVSPSAMGTNSGVFLDYVNGYAAGSL
jgi:hypothetical protein